MSSKVTFKSSQPNPYLENVSDVSPDEVFELMEQVCLIDVRRPDEFSGELGHAPGSQLMTLDTLATQFENIPKDKTVVFICRSGGRSARAAALALENGFKDVHNMLGGMMMWNELGLKTER